MRLVSWNVNGIRACIRKGFLDFVAEEKPDVLALQETKVDAEAKPKEAEIDGYFSYWSHAEKKGYSGVAIYTNTEPLAVIEGIGEKKFDSEGRVLAAEFDKFFLVTAYVPNAQRGLARLDFRLDFDREFLKFCQSLRKMKPVVICGDLNVAHKEIDLKNPKSNEHNAGFTQEERGSFSHFLSKGYIDTFRHFNQEPGHYTWWSYMFNARAKDIGWRIDYFLVSEELKNKLKKSLILKDIMGSDHCPVELQLT